MMVARWSIDARFGYKPLVVEEMKRWLREIGSQVGWTPANARLLNGSVGVRESTIQSEILVEDLAALGAAWEQLARIDAHKAWSKGLEPYIVSGTQKWEIYRVVELD